MDINNFYVFLFVLRYHFSLDFVSAEYMQQVPLYTSNESINM